jgi:hypothetical protein
MTDPTGGAGAKVASEMLKEVQSAMKQAEVAQPQGTPQVEFNQMLNTQRIGEVQEAAKAANQQGATDILRAATSSQRTVAAPAVGTSIDTHPIRSGLHRMMDQVMDGQNKLEEIMRISLSGKNFSSAELLALQAGVYRFTQELELTSKVIEKGTSSIKQTLNTQV